jgi:hypothetical protein
MRDISIHLFTLHSEYSRYGSFVIDVVQI